MTPNKTINPNAAESVPAAPASAAASSSPRGPNPGPGQQIRVAREAASLSLEALAQQTKLAKPTLDALERDDFALLNEAVYIRGYYRKVAKALSIPERDLIVAYEAVVQHKGPPVPTKLLLGSGDNGPHRTRRRLGWSWLLAIVVIGALLFLALRFMGRTPSTASGLSETLSSVDGGKPAGSPTSDASSNTGENALPSAPVSDLPSSSTSTAPATPPAEIPSATKPAAASPAVAAAATADSSSSSSSAADSGSGLSLVFKTASWVRVEDTYGKVLLSGVMPAGSHQSVDGRRPLSVFLGNAPAVSATDAGKPLDFSSHIKDNATARFSVP